jgi:hypothetical protein
LREAVAAAGGCNSGVDIDRQRGQQRLSHAALAQQGQQRQLRKAVTAGTMITTTIIARGSGGGGRMRLWRQHRQAMGMTTIITLGAGGGDNEDNNDHRAKR